VITDYASLQAAIADEMHRLDMAGRIPTFVQNAHIEIARWVKDYSVECVQDPNGCWCRTRVPYELAPLVNGSDSNDVLTQFPFAYLYLATAAGLTFIRDYEGAAAYQAMADTQLRAIANSDLGLRDGFRARPSTSGVGGPRFDPLSFSEGL
jgi:hypothetical protein